MHIVIYVAILAYFQYWCGKVFRTFKQTLRVVS